MSDKEHRSEEGNREVDDGDAHYNKYLLCKLGNEMFGVNITYVTDILELQTITEVPDMPDYVQGVINLRGNVIPVIDLRLRFGMESKVYDDRTVITVVHIEDVSVGFIVDTATEVRDIPFRNIDPPPKFQESAARNRCIYGLGKTEDQVVILLELHNLVSREFLATVKSTAP